MIIITFVLALCIHGFAVFRFLSDLRPSSSTYQDSIFHSEFIFSTYT
jgi:hypothetical protein